ncbi:MAG: FAD:protein FMN transferase, partial [Thermodesulfobacteriota bacterium]
LSSVTVLADSATKADALSTAFSVMGKNKTEEFAKKNDVAGVMIIDGDRRNYKVFKSPGFKSIQEAN